MGRKVCIVFEEPEQVEGVNEKAFIVYLEGMKTDVRKMTREQQTEKLSPVEFWGLRSFEIVVAIVKEYCGGMEIDIRSGTS